MCSANRPEVYDTIIVGGGVVGLAILREATLQGLKCAIIEASPHILSKASGSNSGIACTGVDAAPGTLERALIRDSISRIRIFCQRHNVPMRECGSLVCLWPWDLEEDTDKNLDQARNKLVQVAEESWEAGDSHASILDASMLLAKEPALSAQVKGAVHIPGEIVLDPWLYPIALASHARENGAKIYTSFPFDPNLSTFDNDTKLWTIPKPNCGTSTNIDGNTEDSVIIAKSIVNAAGIQSDLIHLQTKDIPKPPWEAKPRRGQYRIFAPKNPTHSNPLQHPIQPVPTQRTKGIFVFSTLYNQIVVGPTALDQESRTDVIPDKDVAFDLTKHVQRILSASFCHDTSDNSKATADINIEGKGPKSDDCDYHYVGEYVGIRPGTNHRDYQIHFLPEKRWISAAGIRSTGLTASLGIGSYVTNLLRTIISTKSTCSDEQYYKLTPLPDKDELAEMYRKSKDGCVDVNGFSYKVTHPVTKLGWGHTNN